MWIALAVLGISWFTYSVSASSGEVEAARAAIARGAKLVDVRTTSEYADGHLKGAVNIPLSEVEKSIESFGPKDKTVVLYCASGRRSANAKALLVSAGFKEVLDLGGIKNGSKL